MSTPRALLDFQQRAADAVLQRFADAAAQLDALPKPAEPALRERVARHAGAVVLCAPTGSGKTLLAADVLNRARGPVLWFWFAPYAGLVDQAADVLRTQAPALRQFSLEHDRRLDTVRGGGVFVCTWSSVATANQQGRRSRTRSDAGLSLDELLTEVRAQGLRIGCVVDEAHHGFHKAPEARRFFAEVLRPDCTLMMTATPRDRDVRVFEQDTGWRVGDSDQWITVSRIDGVEQGLLKRGIKMVRFIAPTGDLASLVDYEGTALAQCTEMHRHLRQQLAAAGIGLTPLMLVQVPDGRKRILEVQADLVKRYGFAESAVRVHTAEQPDPDLLALAQDPSVEVLVFKMAVALGFDAPRAFTLAALRGARDKDFGVQVIGRLMRVHPLLRHRTNLPDELSYGFVFLANSEAQEGLLSAGEEIARLTTYVPELGPQTVVTVVGATHTVQVLRTGESGSLLLEPDGTVSNVVDREHAPEDAELEERVAREVSTLPLFGHSREAATRWPALTPILVADSSRRTGHRLAAHVPRHVVSEALPPADANLEQRVADLVDFSPAVLGAMHQSLVRVLRAERDVFVSEVQQEQRETYIQAQLDAEQLAARVERQLELFDVQSNTLFDALRRRFQSALLSAGYPLPRDDESLDHALDMVLVRNRGLLSRAHKHARMQGLHVREVALPEVLSHPEPLSRSRRNAYGVYPPGFNSNDERDFAQMLDRCEDVLWWHRNSIRREDSLALYAWDDGAAFYPDFIVSFRGRDTRDHVALVEIKGPRGWGDLNDVRKAEGPAHAEYGRCIFIGRETRGSFKLLKPQDNRLAIYGDFGMQQLRWVER